MTDFNNHPQPRTFAPSKEARACPSPHIAPSPTASRPHPSSRAAQDVLQNLQYFFGAPVSPEKLKDYVRCRAPTPELMPAVAHALLPCACAVGAPRDDVPFPRRVRRPEHQDVRPAPCPCLALPLLTRALLLGSRDTLNNLILKSPQNWQTSVGLPFFQIEGTVVEWDEVKFDGMPLAACARGHERLLTPVLLALRSPPDAARAV